MTLKPIHILSLLFIALLPEVLFAQLTVATYNHRGAMRVVEMAGRNKEFHAAFRSQYFPPDSAMAAKLPLGTPRLLFLSKLLADTSNIYRYKGGKVAFYPVVSLMNTTFTADKENILQIQSGINLKASYKNKLSASAYLVYHFTELAPGLRRAADSTGVLPVWGTYVHTERNKYTAFPVIFNVNYLPWKWLKLTVAHDKVFVGDGYRSLLLSANPAPYYFSRIDFQYWNLRYFWMMGMLQDEDSRKFDDEHYTKPMVTHALSYNITSRANIYLFESVIWQTTDSAGHRGIEWNYMNPVLFYRPAEFAIGSPDNVIMGLGGHVNIFRKTSVYAQILLDEFVFSEVINRTKWWGNKQAYQIGFHSFSVAGISGLTALAEYSYLRPYVYSHDNTLKAYGNLYASLGHPLGGNSTEAIFILNYIDRRAGVQAKVSSAKYGVDTTAFSLGHMVYSPYTTRPVGQDYGNEMYQGRKVSLFIAALTGYYIFHASNNIRFQCTVAYRRTTVGSVMKDGFSIDLGIKTLIYDESIDY